MEILWLVGRWAPTQWEFEGIFATEAEAKEQCDEADMFYAPVLVGQRLETSEARRVRVAAGIPPDFLVSTVYPIPTEVK